MVALQICTRLSKGGPNNATYMSGFTYVMHGHQISVETNLQQASSNDLIGVSTAQSMAFYACLALATGENEQVTLNVLGACARSDCGWKAPGA